MRFLADMNISPKTVDALRGKGWDTIRVSDILPETASDAEILDFARQDMRVLVTQDLDFSALLAIGGHCSPSLITLRLTLADPQSVSARLLAVIPTVEDALAGGCAVTIDDLSVRIRMLPIR